MLKPVCLPSSPSELRDREECFAPLGAPQFDKQNEGGVRSTLLLLRSSRNYRSMQQCPNGLPIFRNNVIFRQSFKFVTLTFYINRFSTMCTPYE